MPISQTVGFTGHRPHKLGNCWLITDAQSKYISTKLSPIIDDIIIFHCINRFITGGAIGFDQIAFWTVHKLKEKYPMIKNIVAVPFENQPTKWKDSETLEWYEKMLNAADEIIYVDEIDGYKITGTNVGEYHVAKLQKRNEYVVDKSSIMVACWDGTSGGTGNCVRYSNKRGKVLYLMNPEKDYEVMVK